ncbi:MAG: flagellar biosynthetic protein FliR [Myxococcales bacterium]|nr:flagellar biosynthetic protein FliR [Myxococcales bacterium]
MRELLEWLGGGAAIERTLWIGGLCACRVAPLTILAPWLSLRSAPAALRAAIILALTLALAPLALASAGDPASLAAGGALGFGVMALREMLLGAVFALATALPLHALDWAGRLVDTWRGASLAEVIAPPTGERTSPLGDLYLMMGVALFVLLGGHRVAIEAFAEGLRIAPLGEIALEPSAQRIALGGLRLAGNALAFAAAIAAPAAVAIVLVEMSLGLIARAAPQIPIFFAGMPLRAATGLAATLLALSLLMSELPAAFSDAIDSASWLLQAGALSPSP